MTSDNMAVVHAYFDALNRGDLDEAVELLDPVVEYDLSDSRGPLRGIYRGRDEVRHVLVSFLEAWEEGGKFFEEEIIELDDVLVRVGGFRGRGKGSGVETSASAAIVFTFKDGRPVSLRMYQTKAKALEDTGIEG